MAWTHDKKDQTENLTGFEHTLMKTCKIKKYIKMGTVSQETCHTVSKNVGGNLGEAL
jgi:hypothetical protein